MGDLLADYDPSAYFDEAVASDGTVRPPSAQVFDALSELGVERLRRRAIERDQLQRIRGVTFSVRADGVTEHRPLPLDVVPRVIDHDDWAILRTGLIQRVRTLNLFLEDIYSDQAALHDRVLPPELVLSAPGYLREAWGIRPRHGVHVHIAGLDTVRGADGAWRVLEDNLRVPSGASYVLENREVLSRCFPELLASVALEPVGGYPSMLLDALCSSAPEAAGDNPRVVVWTPGVHNAAYFEHAFLARQMGIELVEGTDLFVDGGRVFTHTTTGVRSVDVIYRRLDDAWIDPLVFRGDSLLGCPGIVNAARAGTVTLANAIGNGVADDKAVYAFVPDLIRYYLNEEPIIANVPTYLCAQAEDRATVLSRLDQLVVKPVDGAGGHGLLFGPSADEATIEQYRRRIEANPRGFIAQEVVQLSTHPTLVDDTLAPRHVDLRPFVVQGERIEVLPGGLTRVALVEGSMIVNSSQGGGSKDTWVLREPITPPSMSGQPTDFTSGWRPPPGPNLDDADEDEAMALQAQEQHQFGPDRGSRC